MPTCDEVLQLPALLEGAVEPEFIDVNGHMNIRHFLDFCAQSADVICRRVGIDDSYRAHRRLGVFTAEHHIRYLGELREGDKYSVHTRVLDRSAEAVHLLAHLLDRSREKLSCTVEIVLVHVNMDTRRPTEFPDDIAAGWDGWIEQGRQLAWPDSRCGAMGIRR